MVHRDVIELASWGTRIAERYSKKALGTDWLDVIATGPRRKMLDMERELVETKPGPMNHEPWAGKRKR